MVSTCSAFICAIAVLGQKIKNPNKKQIEVKKDKIALEILILQIYTLDPIGQNL